MLHLLFTMQEIATYKNVVKCNDKADISDYSDSFKNGFALYTNCAAEGSDPVYCLGGCNENACATDAIAVTGAVDAFFPVEDMFVLSFAKSNAVKTVINQLDSNNCEAVDVVLGPNASEKKVFYLITCIMFWIAFLLIVATFVLALISISNCGCCRCCNSVKSIFPMKATTQA